MNLRLLTILMLLLPFGGVGAIVAQGRHRCTMEACPLGNSPTLGQGYTQDHDQAMSKPAMSDRVMSKPVMGRESPACCPKMAPRVGPTMSCSIIPKSMADSDMGACECMIQSSESPDPMPTQTLPMGIGDLMRGVSESAEILGIALAIEVTPSNPLPFEQDFKTSTHLESQAVLGIWRI